MLLIALLAPQALLICQRETETSQTQILKDLVHNRCLIDGVSLYHKEMCEGQKHLVGSKVRSD